MDLFSTELGIRLSFSKLRNFGVEGFNPVSPPGTPLLNVTFMCTLPVLLIVRMVHLHFCYVYDIKPLVL
jgi:hypothetical protein